jgi:hypothetical protein
MTGSQTTDLIADLRGLSRLDNVGRTAIRAAEEIEELRACVIAFGAPWAANYAADFGFPPGRLHPTHYDILARCGARMNDFVRGEF